jgi:uroporphyrin-III C-methyltransferase
MIKRLFSFGMFTWLAILALAGAMAWQFFYSDSSESKKIATLTEASEKHQQALEQISGILTTNEQQFQQIADHSNQLVASVKELDAVVRGDSHTWRLMQVQNFLEMAMVQATLLNDTGSAINLLAAAENSLKRIDNANLIPVRKAIQNDILMLANHPVSNVSTIILQLDGIVDQVPTLPHKIRAQKESEPQAPTPAGKDWENRVNTTWQEIKSLVRIQRHDQPVTPYFSKDDIWLINENLSLILEQASFAAAHHYEALYKKQLTHAQEWLKQYYDTNDPAVQKASQTLTDLSKLPVASEINLHLNTVDAWGTFVSSTQAGGQ